MGCRFIPLSSEGKQLPEALILTRKTGRKLNAHRPAPFSKVDDSPLNRRGDGFGAVSHAELAENAFQMRFDRMFRDLKL